MKIGDINKQVVLQYQTRVPDAAGGFTVTWVDHATIWAAVWPLSATEQVQAMQTSMTITHRVRIRYRANVKASWRIQYGERYFDIISIINPNMSNKNLDLLCKEVSG